jgi:caa(3)-type oxidase subunit IV
MTDHAHAHAHDDHAHGDHAHGDHTAQYVKIWAILLVLLAVSVAGPEVASHLGSLELPFKLFTAFGIAVIKAWMVVKFFMHLNLERKFVTYFIVVAVAFMSLFYFAVAPDVMNHDGTNWENVAAKHEIERALKHIEESGGAHH